MRDDFSRHKRSDAAKWVIAFLAIIILAVAVTAALTQGFTDWNPFGWFGSVEEGGTELVENVVQALKLKI